jgi:uncharacterized protein involved in exopolysaccharide biosynthesis
MKKSIVLILTIAMGAAFLSGCTRTQRYTSTGALVGAGTGLAVSGTGTGAAIGAGVGAGAGYLLSR